MATRELAIAGAAEGSFAATTAASKSTRLRGRTNKRLIGGTTT